MALIRAMLELAKHGAEWLPDQSGAAPWDRLASAAEELRRCAAETQNEQADMAPTATAIIVARDALTRQLEQAIEQTELQIRLDVLETGLVPVALDEVLRLSDME